MVEGRAPHLSITRVHEEVRDTVTESRMWSFQAIFPVSHWGRIPYPLDLTPKRGDPRIHCTSMSPSAG
jgi:hypothetical protein